jgi:hypothetical protein
MDKRRELPSDQRDASLAPTRAVALYQVQTVARPALVDATLPATRAYATGMLEQLEPALSAPASRVGPVHALRGRRGLVLGAAALCFLGAATLAVTVVYVHAGVPATKAASAPSTRAEDGAAETEVRRAAAAPAVHAPQLAHAERDMASATASAVPSPAPRVAAESLARGRYREALVAYRQLAQDRPSQPVFAHVAAVLARRLARHCEQSESAGDAACLHDRS